MAIIYSYPTKPTPALTDLVLITDSESTNPKNQTKNATLQSIADLIDGEVTLQEVLDAGNTANNQSITLTGAPGSLSISGFATIGSTLQVTTSAEIANVVYSSSNILSNADLTIANTTGILNLNSPNNIALTSSNASIVLTSGGLAGDDIDLNAGGGDVDIDGATFEVTSKGTSMDATVGTTTIIGDGAISIGDTNTSAINLRSEAGVSITAPTPATADVDSTVVFRGPDGVVDRPTYGFSNNVESGMYYDQAAGYVKVSVDANNIQVFEPSLSHVVATNGLALPNMGSGGSSAGFALSRYAEGEFTCELLDNGAPLGLGYTPATGKFQCINDRVTGSIRLFVTGGPNPFPVATALGVGNFIVSAGPVPYLGTNLLVTLPPDPIHPGNITFSECLGFTGLTAQDAPVAGVTVSAAPSYFLFKKYVDTSAPDTNLNDIFGNFPTGIILTFDFSYNVAAP